MRFSEEDGSVIRSASLYLQPKKPARPRPASPRKGRPAARGGPPPASRSEAREGEGAERLRGCFISGRQRPGQQRVEIHARAQRAEAVAPIATQTRITKRAEDGAGRTAVQQRGLHRQGHVLRQAA